jgi:hypothetical protein
MESSLGEGKGNLLRNVAAVPDSAGWQLEVHGRKFTVITVSLIVGCVLHAKSQRAHILLQPTIGT